MTADQKIEQLQKQIDELSAELKNNQQRLWHLQQDLDQLKGIKTSTAAQQNKITRTNFSFENFIGLRLIHFVGIIVLVIGLSIGVKYAIDRELMSELARIILAY